MRWESEAVRTCRTESLRYTFRFKHTTPRKVLREVQQNYGKYLADGDDTSVDYFRTQEHRKIAAGMTPGKHLRTLRDMAGMTQAQLAERLGIRPSRVSDFEHDREAMGRAMAKRVAALFGTSPALFV